MKNAPLGQEVHACLGYYEDHAICCKRQRALDADNKQFAMKGCWCPLIQQQLILSLKNFKIVWFFIHSTMIVPDSRNTHCALNLISTFLLNTCNHNICAAVFVSNSTYHK